MNPSKPFDDEVARNISGLGEDVTLQVLSRRWASDANRHKYTYNFAWLGRPIIQYPQDIVAMQEIIWNVKPDLIIETGVAHGGSLIFYASMLELIAVCGGGDAGEVLGIDIEIRAHNRAAIEAHAMSKRIHLTEGSSLADEVIAAATARARGKKRVVVCLDSNHTHEHVLAELEAYAPLVSIGSYCVVFDTLIEDMPPDTFSNRPWGKGNNPKTAVREYLRRLQTEGRKAADGALLAFEVDRAVENKLLITVAPEGYLKRVR